MLLKRLWFRKVMIRGGDSVFKMLSSPFHPSQSHQRLLCRSRCTLPLVAHVPAQRLEANEDGLSKIPISSLGLKLETNEDGYL